MSFENIILEVDNSIATLFFNRPKAMNALNNALFDELDIALDQIRDNKDIRVLILTGTGGKAFVAGADIAELVKMNPLEGKSFSRKGQKVFSKIEDLPIPAIAAVNGFALGGGLEAALGCDFIYASNKALFGLPEINLGLIPGFGGTQRLARRIGENLAKEMIFTGKNINAQTALEYGIVNKVCEPDKLMENVLKTAGLIATKGKVALRSAKEVIQSGLNADLETGCRIENDVFGLNMASEDAKEGTNAFLEKRKPVFKGKLY
ncbi:MAG: enoyl-CoA hydratase/isomerase family protein [Desulfobacula sp.]|jgi:enoyl-CoA hydratase|uniref:enoyl-CoA hydratase-related protein n=1 Tax=Desulfobacula sp. TaxID=2593537 RepID=UPI001DBF6C8F|nr:enoyl-CoA hydratase/isomerase family protein [Desulfobacula sp.]MBT3484966.1 enoyl-CoA hydratase/isomerase family protein [Desulfobacula sp.]MBT3803198.1 enoyl-CoA hydratase/isomerase family protein [Desulfobacula sp.]MBT4024581.1 enoyl-CoA hydratase/isomerase family protein [Desulfobacula sp.]MBT4200281.1 enoyl-CoA hydratase/isomerase family protein [Desulfobacula sp.]